MELDQMLLIMPPRIKSYYFTVRKTVDGKAFLLAYRNQHRADLKSFKGNLETITLQMLNWLIENGHVSFGGGK